MTAIAEVKMTNRAKLVKTKSTTAEPFSAESGLRNGLDFRDPSIRAI
jgi:hypothetical protein